MDFTREPIIETVITPREGCKLVVRSSKSTGQEEYFVDALEVVSFGNSFFFRSQERPKSFLVPTTDYEVLEVREQRMALKNVGAERRIKIAGGREAGKVKEPPKEIKAEPPKEPIPLSDKKREQRKRGVRRRRGRGGRGQDEMDQGESDEFDSSTDITPSEVSVEASVNEIRTKTSIVSSLLPPPPTLISEQIQRYKQDDVYKDAFFSDKRKEEISSKSKESEEISVEEKEVVSSESKEALLEKRDEKSIAIEVKEHPRTATEAIEQLTPSLEDEKAD